jgi:hypothetical protein
MTLLLDGRIRGIRVPSPSVPRIAAELWRHTCFEALIVRKPGGRFLLGMPAVNTMMELGFLAIGFKGINERHVTTPRAVASAFDRTGLRLTKHARLRLIPGLPLYFNWLLEKAA